MNIALPVLVIFILILPGIICRSSYYITEKTVLSHRPFTVEGSISLIVAAVLHLLWITIANNLGYDVKFQYVFALVSNAPGELTKEAINNVSEYKAEIAVYFFTLFASSWGMGAAANRLVKRLDLDIKGPLSTIFKFDTPWYYTFKGLVEESEEKDGKLVVTKGYLADSFTFIQVTCSIVRPDDTYLYVGVLENFYFKRDGSLDRIVLAIPSRRKLTDDARAKSQADRTKEPFFVIHCKFLIVKYDDVSSLSIDFIKYSEVGQSESNNGDPVSDSSSGN